MPTGLKHIRHYGLWANPAGSGQGGAEHAHTKPVGHRVCTGVHAARGSGTDSPVPSLPTWAVGGGAGTGRGQTIASAGARAAASPGQRHAGATGMAAEKPTSHASTAVSNIGQGTGWPDRWGADKAPPGRCARAPPGIEGKACVAAGSRWGGCICLSAIPPNGGWRSPTVQAKMA